MRPQEGVLPVLALWRCTGLLLSSMCLCAGVEEGCILGIVGQPVLLPCFYHELSGNFSIEWRKDDKEVLRSVWDEDGNVQTWSLNHASIPADAAQSGNFSLELPAVHPREDGVHYSLFLISGEKNQISPLCSVCFRVAASFSVSLLKREHTAGDEATFLCHSTGGYPKPSVYWLINDALEAPKNSVRTHTEFDLYSHFYNVTSNLTIPLSTHDNVSCIIENQSMNETLRSTYKPSGGPVLSRASEAMWIFSTALCVVVGIMVIAGVAYQIHLDKISKRRKKECREQNRGYRRRRQNREEDEVMNSESKETEV